MKPPFYIAEAPTFSAGEIMVALLILAAIFALFVAVVIVGIQGFHRLGRGRRDSFQVKVAPVIGVLDVLFLLSTIRETPFAVAPLAAHVVAFLFGRNTGKKEPGG